MGWCGGDEAVMIYSECGDRVLWGGDEAVMLCYRCGDRMSWGCGGVVVGW